MSKKELLKRYLFFISGLFMNSVGITLITKAKLGTSPISSFPYTLSMGFPLTLGTFTFIFNMLLIVGQVIVRGREFEKIQLIQIPISVIFGYFIDFSMSMFSTLHPSAYGFKFLTLIGGCTILALGVSIEVTADVVMLSGEALVKAISAKAGKEFGTIKILFDVSLAISSCIISLIMFHSIVGVREGTVVAAVIVGFIAKNFTKALSFVNDRILTDIQEEEFAA